MMNEQAILKAINELGAWERRKLNLKDEMKQMCREERRLCVLEIGKINDQIYHYRRLIRDMKKEVSPPSTGRFLKKFA